MNTAGPITGAVISMNILSTFTNLPIGIYILTGSVYINSVFNSNLQFGLNGTTQNGNLQNIVTVGSTTNGGVYMITTTWIQAAAVNVYFSASGQFTFQNIAASYIRIA